MSPLRIPRRRILLATAATLLAPALRAQQPRKTARIGIVFNSFQLANVQGEKPVEPVMREFLAGLRENGWVEGRNLVIERRSAEGKLDQLEPIIRGLAQQPVDVIVVSGQAAARAAKRATTTVPIVANSMFAPDTEGLVASLARPGGNLTGTLPAFGQEMAVKRLELLHDLLPRARNVVYFGTKVAEHDIPPEVAAAAGTMGVSLRYVDAQLPDLEGGLRRVERERCDALLVTPTVPLYAFYRAIVAFAARARLPDIYGIAEAVEAGGLASYGGDTYVTWRRTASYVAQVLGGAKPGDLPIFKSDRYRQLVNVARAGALGIAIPPAVAQRSELV